MDKDALKKKVVEIISSERLITNPRRVETICRSQINRLSYTMVLGDHCIYLEKDNRKIFIESRCRENYSDGYGRPAYITAYNESKKILERLEAWYEENVRTDSEAV
ncbi:hypothetical protein CL614_00245 [archaeon]|nr:hypothetical protein [archaeon]|tara:strand:+ start:923 stop:1240 length:318 start_codon:yes stop_codon:yes gene_type:complete